MLMSARWILFPFFFAAWAWGNSFVVSLSPQRERRKQTQTHSAPTLPLFEPSRKGILCPKYFSNRRHTTVSRKTCGATTPFFPHLCTINSAQAPPLLGSPTTAEGGKERRTDTTQGSPFPPLSCLLLSRLCIPINLLPHQSPSLHSSFSASAEGIFTMSAFPPPTPAYVQ